MTTTTTEDYMAALIDIEIAARNVIKWPDDDGHLREALADAIEAADKVRRAYYARQPRTGGVGSATGRRW